MMETSGCSAMAAGLALLLAASAVVGSGTKHNQGDPDIDCEALGFTRLALCSDCDVLGEYVKDPELLAECKGCCAVESKRGSQKYSSAVLEVCKHRLGYYPHVKDFLKTIERYGDRVKVKYRFGAYPSLIMKTSDGKTGETVRVNNWNKETLEEFMAHKLENQDSMPEES